MIPSAPSHVALPAADLRPRGSWRALSRATAVLTFARGPAAFVYLRAGGQEQGNENSSRAKSTAEANVRVLRVTCSS